MNEKNNIYIDIKAIEEFFRYNFKIFVITIIFSSISSLIYSYFQTEKYTSYLIIGPANEDSSIRNSLNKLDNLIPFSQSFSKNEDFNQLDDFFITIESLDVMLDFFDPRPIIFSNNFSKEKNLFDSMIYSDTRLLMESLNGSININQLRNSGLLEISTEFKDPKFSEKLLISLHKGNEMLVKKIKKEYALKKIDWLNKEIKESSYTKEKESLSSLLLKELNLLSLIDADVPIVSQVITGPYSTIKPSSPNYLFNLFIFILSSLLILLFYLIRKK
ncbi:MAG: hypothetical protein CMC86_07620 [Flavobacteriaceae bacterium]|nr:hypothetical protein [Flavobacteriaceae bacterium]